MRKVTFGVANSLDNFIARKDGAVDWLLWSDNFQHGLLRNAGCCSLTATQVSAARLRTITVFKTASAFASSQNIRVGDCARQNAETNERGAVFIAKRDASNRL